MPDMEQMATQKIGGVPAWGWAAGIVGIVLVYSFIRNRRNAASASASPVVFDGNSTASGLDMGIPTSSSNFGSGGGTDATAPPTLDQWISNAVRTVGGSGSDALAALNAFIAGQPLSASQKAIVDSVVSQQGLPPNYSSLGAASPSSSIPDYSTALNDAFNTLASQLQSSQNDFSTSIQSQMDALSNAQNTLNIPAKPASTSMTRDQAIANAQNIAKGLGRSVKTAYGWVTPTGIVTSTDTTAAKKADAKAIAIKENRPVNTSFGWIIPNGTVYPTQAAAQKAMGK